MPLDPNRPFPRCTVDQFRAHFIETLDFIKEYKAQQPSTRVSQIENTIDFVKIGTGRRPNYCGISLDTKQQRKQTQKLNKDIITESVQRKMDNILSRETLEFEQCGKDIFALINLTNSIPSGFYIKI